MYPQAEDWFKQQREKNRGRAFRAWLQATQRSLELGVVLGHQQRRQQRRMLQVCSCAPLMVHVTSSPGGCSSVHKDFCVKNQRAFHGKLPISEQQRSKNSAVAFAYILSLVSFQHWRFVASLHTSTAKLLMPRGDLLRHTEESVQLFCVDLVLPTILKPRNVRSWYATACLDQYTLLQACLCIHYSFGMGYELYPSKRQHHYNRKSVLTSSVSNLEQCNVRSCPTLGDSRSQLGH